MNRCKLVIYNQSAFNIRSCKKLSPIFFEISETFTLESELLLLDLVNWSQDSLLALLEIFFLRVNQVQNFKNIVLLSVTVGEQITELTQELEHFIDSLSDH